MSAFADPYAQSSSLGHKPDGAWKFDEKVTAVFDDMLKRSIPELESMRRSVTLIGDKFVTCSTDIVDLGCSRGDGVAPFVEHYGSMNRFVLCDSSEPMLDVCRQRFKGYIDTGCMRLHSLDLSREFPKVRACLVMAVLTLQFIPIERRQSVLKRIYDSIVPGGAFIIVEKVLGATAEIQELFTEQYWALKVANGYSREEVERKAKSLEGVLVPAQTAWNESMLREAGFRQVDCFYRWMNFAGWVAIKT